MPGKPAADEAEATARMINAEPWEPMAGMVKRQCPQCRYFFALPVESPERRCADCASLGTGRGRIRAIASGGICCRDWLDDVQGAGMKKAPHLKRGAELRGVVSSLINSRSCSMFMCVSSLKLTFVRQILTLPPAHRRPYALPCLAAVSPAGHFRNVAPAP
jgi:hypothetical protein